MHVFSNVSKAFLLLQPLDGKDVIPFPAGSDLPLDEAQTIGNCRDLSAFLRTGQVTADDAGRELVAAALEDFRAKEAEAAKAKAKRKG